MPRLRLNRNQPAAHALPQKYEKTGAQINLAIKKLAANISPFATSCLTTSVWRPAKSVTAEARSFDVILGSRENDSMI